jgi:hypothetical protein
MSVFTGSLIIAEVVPGRRWRLAQPLRYEACFEGSDRWIEIPDGFECDGASIPWPLSIFLAVWGTYGRAACLHDYGYTMIRRGNPHRWMMYRAAVDAEFYIAMRACGTGRILAGVMWAAVRLFGRAARHGDR